LISKIFSFGFLFIETTVGEDQELNQILTSDLRKYIKLKKNHKEAVQKVSFWTATVPTNYSKISSTFASTGAIYQVVFSVPLDVAHN